MIAQPWRQRILFAALAVTIILSATAGMDRQSADEMVMPSRQSMPGVSGKPAQSLPRIELERLQRQDEPAGTAAAASHTFKAISWYVPPPPPPPPKPLPPPPPPPPPPPTAPPMPFSFLGRYEEGGKLIILLVRSDRIYTVSEGEVIDNTYRVERLTGGQLELTYLPLNIKQTISAGGA
jgi:hypothetical protein